MFCSKDYSPYSHSKVILLPHLNSVILFIADGELKEILPLLTLGLLSK